MDQAAAPAVSRLRKALKYGLIAGSALVLALIAAAAYVAATFDPRDLHPRAIELVREKTGRELAIRGETSLSFWPRVGVVLRDVSLSERDTAQTFASVESVRVALEIVPLFRREIVATELAIAGARAQVTRDAHGRFNIEDFFAGEGGPPRFDIGRVAIERSTLTYRDLAAGTRYELGAIEAGTGRIADGLVTPLDFAALFADESAGVKVRLKLRTGLELDFAGRRYALRSPHLDATGRYGGDEIAATLDAARLALAPGPATGEAVRATLLAKGAAGTTDVKLSVPKIEEGGGRIAASAAALELALERGEHRVQASASTPVEIDLPANAVRLAEVRADIAAFGPRLPGKGLQGALTGEAKIDLAKEGIHARLAGKVGETRVKAQVAATGFASPAYSFAVELDRLDLDRYAAVGPAGRKAPRPAAVQDLLEALEGLPASGTLVIGVLESGGTRATGVKVALR